MRKYLLLAGSAMMILLPLYFLYSWNKPRTGALGDGTIAPAAWISLISSIVGGFCFFILGILMLIREKRVQNEREI
ncbi:hypothetical protein [Falsibacillus albus]|uniref:Uncharacterized protein n=1 Tax=Falsibacillus albus TaxID=2478915 RepID=A0A3L7K5E3_9BACI|nr:hypothetical protein [Falsibacillus albus]RLQ97484.1 hypothetical protein D9X91_04855 [Falsibacillus albus]